MPTALITGVNRGLGLEFVKQYSAAGWDVIGTCRDLVFCYRSPNLEHLYA